jgi:hypothetical protein
MTRSATPEKSRTETILNFRRALRRSLFSCSSVGGSPIGSGFQPGGLRPPSARSLGGAGHADLACSYPQVSRACNSCCENRSKSVRIEAIALAHLSLGINLASNLSPTSLQDVPSNPPVFISKLGLHVSLSSLLPLIRTLRLALKLATGASKTNRDGHANRVVRVSRAPLSRTTQKGEFRAPATMQILQAWQTAGATRPFTRTFSCAISSSARSLLVRVSCRRPICSEMSSSMTRVWEATIRERCKPTCVTAISGTRRAIADAVKDFWRE